MPVDDGDERAGDGDGIAAPRRRQRAFDLVRHDPGQPAAHLHLLRIDRLPDRKVMIVNGVPQIAVRMGEAEIAGDEGSDAVFPAFLQRRLQGIGPGPECPRVHRGEQPIERAIDIIERPHGVADALGDLARGESGEPHLGDVVMRLLKDQCLEFLSTMIRSASHDCAMRGYSARATD